MPTPRIFLARQPVFTADGAVYGYKLLSRSSNRNAFAEADGDRATLNLIGAVQYAFGFAATTGGGHAFLNVTRDVLVGGLADSLPPEHTVLELPASLALDGTVRTAVRGHRTLGYRFAVAAREPDGEWTRMLDHIDVLGIDFRLLPNQHRHKAAHMARTHRLTLHALKLESHEEVKEARELGCALLQGFELGVPEMLVRTGVSHARLSHLRLLQELLGGQLRIEDIEHVIRAERTLTEELLKRVNSIEFGPSEAVSDVRSALMLMGERRLRQWCARIGLTALQEERISSGAVPILTRAKLCEMLAPMFGLPCSDPAVFLAGLFGRLDPFGPGVRNPRDEPPRQQNLPVTKSPDDEAIDERIVRLLALAEALVQGATTLVIRLAREYEIPEDALGPLAAEAERRARASMLEGPEQSD